ncbi:MAG: hypothetical protein A4E35_00988 [Methanoregula sp. PtaU1.Bin051]|nr:MAG: hypothetical protein A4E35_00988 [Methanoregula sp. PtaU1.Bin051]
MIFWMAGYKHIERCIGDYIARHYAEPVEIGVGGNMESACIIRNAGRRMRCTDIKNILPPEGVEFYQDDIFNPVLSRYEGADVLYAIRPAEETIPPMIALAERLSCDLIVYHLGFESFGDGGEIIDCGVLLHRYHRA